MVDYDDNIYNRRGGDGRDHIPQMPFWLALIRVAQFLVNITVIGLVAYGASVFSANYFEGYPIAFFTFTWTIIFLVYIFVAPLWFPPFYLYWAHLGLEWLTTLFWFVTLTLLAQEASTWGGAQVQVNGVNNMLRDVPDLNSIHPIGDIQMWPHAKQGIGATKAAAFFGGLHWLLSVINFGAFGHFLHKHRVEHGVTAQMSFLSPERRAVPM